MKRFVQLAAAATLALSLTPVVLGAVVSASATTVTCQSPYHDSGFVPGPGFDACGYNYSAMVFSGPADGVDGVLDGTVYGDPTYANDHLVMKWNAAWVACNANGYDNATYCAGAWVTNEWNGMAGGSQTTDHVKIIWVGSAGAAGPYWVSGGLSIWNNYEILMDQGMVGGVHTAWTFASPNGLG